MLGMFQSMRASSGTSVIVASRSRASWPSPASTDSKFSLATMRLRIIRIARESSITMARTAAHPFLAAPAGTAFRTR